MLPVRRLGWLAGSAALHLIKTNSAGRVGAAIVVDCTDVHSGQIRCALPGCKNDCRDEWIDGRLP